MANFHGMKIDFLAETVFSEEAKQTKSQTTGALRNSNKQTTSKTKARAKTRKEKVKGKQV